MKIMIIGGIAGGLSAASQIKREDHGAQVIVDKPIEDLYALGPDTVWDPLLIAANKAIKEV